MKTWFESRLPERLSYAIHEAGHAVMAVHPRRVVRSVTIRSWGRFTGRCSLAPRKVRAVAAARAVALILLAGWAAATVHRVRYILSICHDDFDAAHKLIRRWKLDDFATLKCEARAMMQHPENMRAVSALAQELLDRETLSGRAVRRTVLAAHE